MNMLQKSLSASEAHDLRRKFESSIAQVQPGKERSRANTPIFVRKQTAMPGDPITEKRALTDAARALAQLWNISPTLVR
jgi:hypothetical protein